MLLVVDLFLNVAMQEGVGDIELMSWPSVCGHKCQHRPDRGGFNHRRECLNEVDTRALVEPPDDPSSFVVLDGAIGVHLVFEDPLYGDDACPRRTRDELPGLVCL